jgi:hypothetical protein
MPTTSCKEPTKESQDTKPSVVKWGCEGPILINLVLPPAMKARALVEAGCAQLRAGRAHLRGAAYGGGKGTHTCEEGGAHVCGGHARLLGGAHASGVGRARLRGRRCAHLRGRARTLAMRGGACTSAGVGPARLRGGGRMVFSFFWVFRTSLPNKVRHTVNSRFVIMSDLELSFLMGV